ncbi:FBP domain-containing protein [Subtercola boreus]|uniref:Translation elongation factor n=1 Tax=Subtercola boreus TaxID=120213 RepID=A0A3E0W962_9MICO|nr:FBP domain-containing protein [Subtercola boreus]RFA18211.1 translation elongation factor [Subtercola boreus]RFA18603.1 translation elongation factor [Subtercola boreus]RFA24683.1 translation elongation factor [Subtercola boreus]
MLPLSEEILRASFVNASRRELNDVTLPAGFADLDFDRLDYLGWRDPRMPRRGLLVVPVEGEPVGVILKQAEASPRSRAQCAWCQDVTLPNDVVLYSAKRAGAAGRNGNTIGTLLCANFECSANVRKLPPMAYIGFDAEAARERRISVLREHASAFAADVRLGA